MHTVMIAVLVGACVAGCSSTPPAPAARPWPTKGWTMSTPEAEGFDAAALTALDAEFAAGTHGQVTSMFITRHGRVVVDKTYEHDFEQLFGHGAEPGLDPVRARPAALRHAR